MLIIRGAKTPNSIINLCETWWLGVLVANFQYFATKALRHKGITKKFFLFLTVLLLSTINRRD